MFLRLLLLFLLCSDSVEASYLIQQKDKTGKIIACEVWNIKPESNQVQEGSIILDLSQSNIKEDQYYDCIDDGKGNAIIDFRKIEKRKLMFLEEEKRLPNPDMFKMLILDDRAIETQTKIKLFPLMIQSTDLQNTDIFKKMWKLLKQDSSINSKIESRVEMYMKVSNLRI